MSPIDQAMQSDHERLDRVLAATAQAVEAGRWQEAREALTKFRRGIEDGHMVVEERTLFPAFEGWEGGSEHPLTALLRKGHQDLRIFFTEMAEAIGAEDAEEFGDLYSTVQIILRQHDAKEESELYPFLAGALADHGAAVAEEMERTARESRDE